LSENEVDCCFGVGHGCSKRKSPPKADWNDLIE
jgi:hypothetical protein